MSTLELDSSLPVNTFAGFFPIWVIIIIMCKQPFVNNLAQNIGNISSKSLEFLKQIQNTCFLGITHYIYIVLSGGKRLDLVMIISIPLFSSSGHTTKRAFLYIGYFRTSSQKCYNCNKMALNYSQRKYNISLPFHTVCISHLDDVGEPNDVSQKFATNIQNTNINLHNMSAQIAQWLERLTPRREYMRSILNSFYTVTFMLGVLLIYILLLRDVYFCYK